MVQGHAPDSRCLDYFVHGSLLPQGRGLEGKPTYREHVVPCVLLCIEATTMLQHTLSVEEVAEWDPALPAGRLDRDHAPGLDIGRGCTYARLHAAHILFTQPEAGPECCGWTIDRQL